MLKACTGKIKSNADKEPIDKCFDGTYYESHTQIKNTNGYVDELTTDNGSEFTNEKFKALCVKYNIDQLYKTPGTHDIGTIDRAIGVWKNNTENPKHEGW